MRTLAALLLLAAVGAAQSIEALLPDTTLLVLSIDDARGSVERLKKGPLGALWDDPRIAPWRVGMEERYRKLRGQQIAEQGLDIEDLWGHLRGRLVLAVPQMAGDLPGIVVIADIERPDELLRLLLEVEKIDAEKNRTRVRREEFRGITLRVNQKADDAGTAPRTCYAIHGGRFYAGFIPAVKAMLARLSDDGGASLAEADTYRTVRAATGARGDVRLFVNVAALLRQMDERDQAIFRALGFMDVRSVGAQVELRDDGIVTRLLLHAPGERRGLLGFLAGANAELSPDATVPPDAEACLIVHGSIKRRMVGLFGLLRTFQPAVGRALDEQAKSIRQQFGFDPVDDLLGSFGDRFTLFLAGKDTGAVLPVTNGEKLTGICDTLAAGAPALRRSDDFLGFPLFTVGAGGFAIVPGRLLYSERTDYARTLVQRHGKDLPGLAGQAGFKRALGRLPERNSILWYSDPAKSTGASSAAVDGFWRGLEGGLRQGLGFLPRGLALPAAGLTRDYRDTVAWSLSTRDDGVLFTHAFGLKKPE
ncbi:MAG: hypothetical protein ACYTGN_11365 [Planctomycetota bacterium]